MTHSMRWPLRAVTAGVAIFVVACTAMQSGGGASTSTAGSAAGGGSMSFFVTSVGSGKGGDLGGLAGADRHCQNLAAAAGAGNKTWRAYLSTQGKALDDREVVHARDRIGTGPWRNAKGVRIARNADELHSKANNINKDTALDEKGQPINDRDDEAEQARHPDRLETRWDGLRRWPLRRHDVRQLDQVRHGRSAMVGHHDAAGPIDDPWAKSWNSSHPTAGCGQSDMVTHGRRRVVLLLRGQLAWCATLFCAYRVTPADSRCAAAFRQCDPPLRVSWPVRSTWDGRVSAFGPRSNGCVGPTAVLRPLSK